MSVPIEQLQTDATAKLNAEEYFSTVSVKSIRKEQIQSEIDRQLPHLTTKAGKLGVGVLVGMPTLTCEHPNLSGPELTVELPLLVLEEPTINLDATTGTLKSAEAVVLKILAALHQFQIEGLCNLFADKTCVTPTTEYEGLIGYTVTLRGLLPQAAPSRCLPPTISSPAQTVTLTNQTSGASIYYTTDATFPSSANSSNLYSAPFVVTSGTVVRWAAYKTGLQGSDISQATIN